MKNALMSAAFSVVAFILYCSTVTAARNYSVDEATIGWTIVPLCMAVTVFMISRYKLQEEQWSILLLGNIGLVFAFAMLAHAWLGAFFTAACFFYIVYEYVGEHRGSHPFLYAIAEPVPVIGMASGIILTSQPGMLYMALAAVLGASFIGIFGGIVAHIAVTHARKQT